MKAVGQQSQKLSSLTKEAEVIAEKFENQQADIDRKKMELEQKMEQMQLVEESEVRRCCACSCSSSQLTPARAPLLTSRIADSRRQVKGCS